MALTTRILILFLSAIPLAIATDHIVGANRGWQVPADAGPDAHLNYTDWAGNHTFYVGDSLTFRYERDKHSVFQVNYSTYVNCTINIYYGHDWIYNWSNKVGRVVIPLNESKPLYFVCAMGGHCQQGMKVAINVTTLPSNQSSQNGSPSGDHKTHSNNASALFFSFVSFMGLLIYTSLCLLL